MIIYDFSTSLKCDGCVAKITPGMNAINGVKNWRVDMTPPVKILHVEADSDVERVVVATVKDQGFTIELLHNS